MCSFGRVRAGKGVAVADPGEQLQYGAASMYYLQGETMESIARQLGMSRSSVSRLLKNARESGMVQITLNQPGRSQSSAGRALEKLFGIRVHVVPVRDGSSEILRLDRVARTAGHLFSEVITDNMLIGVAWGTTLAAVVQHLVPHETFGSTVVQTNGSANHSTSGIPYVGAIISAVADAFGCDVVHFPVPAFFDFASTKEAMWRERMVTRVLGLQSRLDLVIFGVGALEGPLQSHVYASGYLDEEDTQQVVDEHVVGDICTVLLRRDGSWQDIPLNARASGITPAQLQSIPRRICVASGQAKALPLLGALRARVATDLVVDELTARTVLELM